MIKVFSTDNTFYELVSSFIIKQIVQNRDYNQLLVFWSSLTVWSITSMKNYQKFDDETIIGKILPHISSIINKETSTNSKISAYMILAVLSSQSLISKDVNTAAIESIASTWDTETVKSGLACISQLIQNQPGNPDIFSKDIWLQLSKIESMREILLSMDKSYKISKFITSFSISLVEYQPEEFQNVIDLINQVNLPISRLSSIIDSVVKVTQKLNDLNIENLQSQLTCIFNKWLSDPKTSFLVLKSLKINETNIDELELLLQASLNTTIEEDKNEDEEMVDATNDQTSSKAKKSNKAEAEQLIQQFHPTEQPTSYLTPESNTAYNELFLVFSKLVILNAQEAQFDQLFSKVSENVTLHLTFLARVFTTPNVASLIKLSSLFCFNNFLDKIEPRSIGLQSFLVSLLCSLSDSNRKCRILVGDILKKLSESHLPKIKKSSEPELFGGKFLYGSNNNKTDIWISGFDTKLFIDNYILTNLEEIIINPSSLFSTIHDLFDETTSKSIKAFASLIFTFLSTQALTIELPSLKMLSLKLINNSGVNTKLANSRTKMFSSLIDNYIIERLIKWKKLCQDDSCKINFEEFEFEIINIISFNEKEQPGITFLENAFSIGDEKLCDIIATKILEIWDSLKPHVQLSLFRFLIDSSLNEKFEYDINGELLLKLNISIELFINILNDYKLSDSTSDTVVDGTSSPQTGIAKRRRRSSTSAKNKFKKGDFIPQIAKTHLQKVSLTLELLEHITSSTNSNDFFKNVKDNSKFVELLGQLFTILNEIATLGNELKMPILYIQELLANIMISVMKELRNIIKSDDLANKLRLDSNATRTDLLVTCIRESESPQLQNKLLLLISIIAELAPENVFHSLMPIFTFMGTRSIKQDDAYSNFVVDETISKVVPAIAKSGKENMTEEAEFILKSFMVPFIHIPSHRRVNIFLQLSNTLKTLDGQSSLGKIFFLMGQKYSKLPIEKLKEGDENTILEFSELFGRHFTVAEQFQSLLEYIKLWRIIPFKSFPANESLVKDEVAKLIYKRHVFDNSLLELSQQRLIETKAELLQFINNVVIGGDIVSEIKSLRLRVAIFFANPNTKANEIEEILSIFSEIVHILILCLDDVKTASSVVSDVKEQHVVINDAIFKLLGSTLDLLPIGRFVKALCDLSTAAHGEVIKRRVISLIKSKFALESPENQEAVTAAEIAVPFLLESLKSTSQNKDDISLAQTSIDGLQVVVSRFGAKLEPKLLTSVLDLLVEEYGLKNSQTEIIISSMACIGSICSILGIRMIGYFSKIVPTIIGLFETTVETEAEQKVEDNTDDGEEDDSDSDDDDDDEEDSEKESKKLIQTTILILIAGLIKRIPSFMITSLNSILSIIYRASVSDDLKKQVIDVMVQRIDLNEVIPSFTSSWKDAVKSGDASIELYLHGINVSIEICDRKTAIKLAPIFVKFLLETFELRGINNTQTRQFDFNALNRIEASVAKTGIEYIGKLNDGRFRPLFTTMVNWAVDGDGVVASIPEEYRLISFFKFFGKLQEHLKGLVTDYYKYIFESAASVLERLSSGEFKSNGQANLLTRVVLKSLNLSFRYDSDEFWKSESRYALISEALLGQLQSIEASNLSKLIIRTIVTFEGCTSSEENNARLADGLTKHLSSSCSSEEKIMTIRILRSIYRKNGDAWMSLVLPMIPTITELLEDDDEEVILEVKQQLIPTIEDVSGESFESHM